MGYIKKSYTQKTHSLKLSINIKWNNTKILQIMIPKNKIKLKKKKRNLRFLDYKLRIIKYKRLIINLNEYYN